MTGTAHYGAEPARSPTRAPDGLTVSQGLQAASPSQPFPGGAPEDTSNGGVAVAADKVGPWARVRPIDAGSIAPSEVARTAQERVPTNVYGLPLGIYRADLMAPSVVLRGQIFPEDLPEPPEPEPGQPSRASSRFIRHNGKPVLVLDERVLRQAYVGLNYDEGYPQLPNGGSFWERLPWEPHEAHVAFKAYIEQGLKGARYTAGLAADVDLQRKILGTLAPEGRGDLAFAVGAVPQTMAAGAQAEGSTSLQGTQRGGDSESTDLRAPSVGRGVISEVMLDDSHRLMILLREWYYIYQWAYRAKAFDQFYVASLAQQRRMTAMRLEGEHFLIGERLAQKVLVFMGLADSPDGKIPEEALTEDNRNRFWAEATPKVLLEALSMATKLQRVSLGMQGAAPSVPLVVQQTTNVQTAPNAPGASSKPAISAGDNADGSELSDDERARRIASILDAARARAAGRALVGSEAADVAGPSGASG